MTQAPVRPADFPARAEQALLDAVSIDEPWALVERFGHLTREAGTADELTAMRYVADRLSSFGVAHTLHMPTLLISLPRRGSLVVDPDGERRSVMAKTPAFSLSTGDRPLRGELVYLPTGHATSVADFFASNVGEQARQMDIRGKVVITEGRSAPQKVADLAAFGPLALIFVNPGEKIHEGICTTIWGSPDLDSLPRLPQSVVLTLNKPDGTALIEQAKRGGVQVEIETVLETGWRPCPVLVAEISGSEAPDEFVLLHGHLDSWHVGISDNATGDATMLEVARLLGQPAHRPKRSVRIAWWTGHSQGRYAGSTWYADTFGVDLAANCVAQVNCDSTGSRWATEYYDVTWMPECEALGLATIRAATGQSATGDRPLRAGDYAFNNLGVSGVLMLSSSIPREKLKALGYHVVGGSGGNIAWHTEDDTLELADRANLLRDTKLYALTVQRLANATLHPLDFTATADDWLATLRRYQQAAGDRFDLTPAVREVERLRAVLSHFSARTAVLAEQAPADPAVREANRRLRRIGRIMVSTHFSREGQFRQDPACPVPPLPDLAPALQIPQTPPGSDRAHALNISLVRGRNRVVWAAVQAAELAEG